MADGGEGEAVVGHRCLGAAGIWRKNATEDGEASGVDHAAEDRREAQVGVGRDIGEHEVVAAGVVFGEDAGADAHFGADAVGLAVLAGDLGGDGVDVDRLDGSRAEEDGGDREHAGASADIEHRHAGADEFVHSAEAEAGGLVVAGAEGLAGVQADGDLPGLHFVLDPGGDDDDAVAGVNDAEEFTPADGPILLVDGLRGELDGGIGLHGTAQVLGEDGAEFAAGEVGAHEHGLAAAHLKAEFGAEDIDRLFDRDPTGRDAAHQLGHFLDERGRRLGGDFEPERHGGLASRQRRLEAARRSPCLCAAGRACPWCRPTAGGGRAGPRSGHPARRR